MEKITTNTELIADIAWTLTVAANTNQLNVDGEYLWSCPKPYNFTDLRGRSKSIFSSGNAIKDQCVIEYMRSININHCLQKPTTVDEFQDYFVYWLNNGSYYNLQNIELFTHKTFSSGSQESFLNFYIMNKNKRFRVFRGDYWWHMEIWDALGLNWCYIEEDDITNGDICLLSYPFAHTGDKHAYTDELINTCNRLGIELLIDFIYLPNSINCVDIDLSAECINTITFSLSKTFPVQTAKIALRLSKHDINDPMSISHKENISNRLSAALGLAVIKKFDIDYNVNKYVDRQQNWCKILGLQPTKVVHFAIGEDYTSFGRQDKLWFSEYNIQHNRYNLGILYENEELLKQLGYYNDKPK